MRGQICEMCESRPATCGLIDIVNQETVFLCYHCAEKLEDIHERLWGHVVRCKDCKYWVYEDIWDSGHKRHLCSEPTTDEYEWDERDANDFCSRGVRR